MGRNSELGPVVLKPINANPRFKVNQGVFLFSKVLFNVDIRQNFTLGEGNFEKHKISKETFVKKLKI